LDLAICGCSQLPTGEGCGPKIPKNVFRLLRFREKGSSQKCKISVGFYHSVAFELLFSTKREKVGVFWTISSKNMHT
jgi:hypothetical protein